MGQENCDAEVAKRPGLSRSHIPATDSNHSTHKNGLLPQQNHFSDTANDPEAVGGADGQTSSEGSERRAF